MDSVTGAVPPSPFTTTYLSGTTGDLQRLYQGVLGRDLDGGGLQYWTSQIGGGTPLTTVGQVLAASPEFAARYGSLSDTAFVTTLYQNMFGRAPDQAGLTGWLAMLTGGASRGVVAANIAASNEANLSGHQTADDVAHSAIYRLYEAAFGRAPDDAGGAVWTTLLAHGTSLQQIAASIAGSAEFAPNATTSASNFVTTLYSNELHRSPDSGGLAAWTASLTGGMTRAAVMTAFSNTPEALSVWGGKTVLSTELILQGPGGVNVSVPGSYNYVIENDTAADTLTASNAAVVENAAGGTVFLSGNSTLAAAGGAHSVSATGNYAMSFGGTADNVITAAGSGTIAMDAGNTTITATSASTSLSVVGGTGPITFLGAGNFAYSIAGIANATLNAATATGNVTASLGGSGADSITTGAGNDTLIAGAGSETLNAGAGNNLFQFVLGQTGSATTYITDTSGQLANDTFSFVNYTSFPTTGLSAGHLTVTLSDSTTLVFTNLTSVSQIGHINISNTSA